MKESESKRPKVKRSRTRSGCFTCRDRHMKCDEQLPVCQNCINSKRKCYRGIRLNFTQYTLFDPNKTQDGRPRPPASLNNPQRKHHRLVDQSIAVSQLYKNGARSYEQYKHLHSQTDLNEAVTLLHQDLQLNTTAAPENVEISQGSSPVVDVANTHNDYLDFFDQWLNPSFNVGQSADFAQGTMPENLDIKHILMNPGLHEKQLGGVIQSDFNPNVRFLPHDPVFQASSKSRFASDMEPELYSSANNARGFIRLIRNEKYYWLLDLFNELNIWKTCIPNYCVRLYQLSEMPDTKPKSKTEQRMLLSCLLACAEHSSLGQILDSAKAQLDQWKELESKDITFALYGQFEKILISIALILMALLLHTTRPGFSSSKDFKMLLANQGRLLHKFCAKYTRILDSTIKRLDTDLFTVASFEAVTILRFFLKMRLRQIDRTNDVFFMKSEHPVFDPLESNISYNANDDHDVAELFTLPDFEVDSLSTKLSQPESAHSDSEKLRICFWRLVKYDHDSQIDRNTISKNCSSNADPTSPNLERTTLVPNSKCIAIHILDSYLCKISADETARDTSKRKLLEIFSLIDASLMQTRLKSNWKLFFGWTLVD